MATLIGRKVNKAGVSFDAAGTSILYAEDWNNVADQTESLVARVSAIETAGAPGSAQLVLTASGNPTMTVNLTSGIEVSITMNANATVQLQYTADANNFGVFFVRNQPGGTLTWPNISWDTADGLPVPLTAGDGIMTVIGIYERFGVLRGFLIDKNVRVSQPIQTVPVAGGVLQLRYDEGSGSPRDTSGKANHPVVTRSLPRCTTPPPSSAFTTPVQVTGGNIA